MQTVLYHALELFCFCLAVHVLVWRAFEVRHQGIRLGLIFLLGPMLMLGIYLLASRLMPGSFPSVDWSSWGLACLLHCSLSGAYLFFFTAVSGYSPSIAILERVEESMPQGLKREELAPKWFTDTNLTGARRENLLATGFIYESDGRLHLSPRGRLIAICFLAFRRLLGLSDLAKG